MRILLIDDFPHFDELIRKKLEKTIDEEINIHQTFTCRDGLFALSMGEFDLVLLDQKLAGQSGLECFKEIRVISTCIPVIMITEYATKELMDECMREGADDFVSKDMLDILLAHVVWSAVRRRMAKNRIETERQQKEYAINAIEENVKTTPR